MTSYAELLHAGKQRVGIWGLGYIGYSSMAHLARSGVACVGFDVDEQKLRNVRDGNCAIPNMEYWLGFDVRPLTQAGLMRASERWEDMISADVLVHLICVPTEQGARPYDEALRTVCQWLSTYASVPCDPPRLAIIESTIGPTVVDRVVLPVFESAGVRIGEDLLLGTAPRRDWFISPEKSLRTLPRIVGGTTPETSSRMKEVLGIVSETVLEAPDHRHAALVKSIENAYRQVEIALANQLSRAYPGLDIKEVLRLVGTKWNIGTYQPSFGTGGYCIPLAPHYVLEGAANPDALTILHASVASEDQMPHMVAKRVLERYNPRKVGIAGLAYKGDLAVSVLSPTIRLVEEFRESGVEVKVHDPYFTQDEIRRLVQTETFDFPEGLGEFDVVMVVADHLMYRAIPADRLSASLGGCRVILDNTGVWSAFRFNGIPYFQAGERNWL